MNGSSTGQTLREWALQDVLAQRPLRLALGIVAAVLATTFGAYVAIPLPFTPVPVTLQPLFVILAGALLGPWAGAGAMAAYLAAGAAGAPVFSNGHAGIAWLLGPTGGYLVAYPAAAFLVGALVGSPRRARPLRAFLALAAGVLVLYAGGVSQLWILTREGLGELLAVGVLPFVVGDLLKVLLATALLLGLPRTGDDDATSLG